MRVAHDLRVVHRFNGYIHLKSIPGASEELVRQAGLYADRLSVNLEIPTEENLKRLAPEKDHQSVYLPMRYIQQGWMRTGRTVAASEGFPFCTGRTEYADDCRGYCRNRPGYPERVFLALCSVYHETCVLFGIRGCQYLRQASSDAETAAAGA